MSAHARHARWLLHCPPMTGGVTAEMPWQQHATRGRRQCWANGCSFAQVRPRPHCLTRFQPCWRQLLDDDCTVRTPGSGKLAT